MSTRLKPEAQATHAPFINFDSRIQPALNAYTEFVEGLAGLEASLIASKAPISLSLDSHEDIEVLMEHAKIRYWARNDELEEVNGISFTAIHTHTAGNRIQDTLGTLAVQIGEHGIASHERVLLRPTGSIGIRAFGPSTIRNTGISCRNLAFFKIASLAQQVMKIEYDMLQSTRTLEKD